MEGFNEEKAGRGPLWDSEHGESKLYAFLARYLPEDERAKAENLSPDINHLEVQAWDGARIRPN